MRRRACRRARRHPVLTGLVILAVVVLFWHVLPELLLLAAVAGAGYWLGLRRRPVTRTTLGMDMTAVISERDRLAAQVDQLSVKLSQKTPPAPAPAPPATDIDALRAELARRADQVSKRVDMSAGDA